MAKPSSQHRSIRRELSKQEKEEIRNIIEQIPAGGEVDEEKILDMFPTDKYLSASLYLESLIDDSPGFCQRGSYWVARVRKVVCPVCGTFIGHTIHRDITVSNTIPIKDWKCPSCGTVAVNLTNWKGEFTLQKK